MEKRSIIKSSEDFTLLWKAYFGEVKHPIVKYSCRTFRGIRN